MKILSYNVNGIRSALNKGLDIWMDASQADIVCLQEIKAKPEQFDEASFNKLGYHCFLNSAEKPGYSGVAILSKIKPNHVEIGCGLEKIDFEGRVIRVDFDDYSVMSVYFPSGSNPLRQSFKMEFLDL
jgi:exodeoxyribonuclease III